MVWPEPLYAAIVVPHCVHVAEGRAGPPCTPAVVQSALRLGAMSSPGIGIVHVPQSAAHVEHVSLLAQTWSPQAGHGPQSCAQVEHVSLLAQTWSPQASAWPGVVALAMLEYDTRLRCLAA